MLWQSNSSIIYNYINLSCFPMTCTSIICTHVCNCVLHIHMSACLHQTTLRGKKISDREHPHHTHCQFSDKFRKNLIHHSEGTTWYLFMSKSTFHMESACQALARIVNETWVGVLNTSRWLRIQVSSLRLPMQLWQMALCCCSPENWKLWAPTETQHSLTGISNSWPLPQLLPRKHCTRTVEQSSAEI